MKTLLISATMLFGLLAFACSSDSSKKSGSSDGQDQSGSSETSTAGGDDKTSSKSGGNSLLLEGGNTGIGPVANVKLTDPLKEDWAEAGKNIYEIKCASCHKLNDERISGPGWQGVTNRRKPEWIMNFVLNTDVMLDKDDTAKKLLEQCLTRMPNQGLSKEEARNVLEFMRKNDEKTTGKKDEAA